MSRSITSQIAGLAFGNQQFPQSLNEAGIAVRQPAPSLRNIATRMMVPRGFYTGNKEIQTRTAFFCRDNVTSLRIVLPQFYVPDAFTSGALKYAETALGALSTWTASIEYPSGSFTQVTFDLGSTSGSALSDNSYLVSDIINLATPIPAGALAWVRLFMQNSAGVLFSNDNGTGTSVVQNVALGDACEAASSGLTDKTMGGTINNSSPGNALTPLAILSVSSIASPILLGDSKLYGEYDVSNINGDAGQIARSIGPNLPYLNCGIPGDGATVFTIPGYAKNRIDLAQRYFSSLICQYGFNDIHGGFSVQDTLECLRQIWQIKASSFQSTISVKTNQQNTIPDPTNIQSQELNSILLSGPFGLSGAFNIADVTDNGMFWRSAAYTADGSHESVMGYTLEQNSGAINTKIIL